ncbi:hypothetical protein [Rhodovulum sulfidophilum]|uniref:hypothetical protein n=1 Tax=Rhodovulum sulfidophilum TaxID=35806 RepID=UPI00138A2B89|nr:hypothetical protein [Rhodovulum sulfidophilum]NDK37092.1 hypothetical protein [Rhodovulum sulfidophilum]
MTYKRVSLHSALSLEVSAMHHSDLPPVPAGDPSPLRNYVLWLEEEEEEEGGDGGGAFDQPAAIYVYNCLSGLFSEHSDIGASVIRAFRDFD